MDYTDMFMSGAYRHGANTTATPAREISPDDLVNPLLRAYQEGVRPDMVQEEVRRLFPGVADFDTKYRQALVVLSNAKQVQGGVDIFGRTLSEGRGFLGFLRALFQVTKEGAQALKDPGKIAEGFTKYVSPTIQNEQVRKIAEAGVKAGVSKLTE